MQYFTLLNPAENTSRIFSIFILMVIELAIAGFVYTTDSEIYLILTFIFSLFAAICNFLGLLLPNLSSCKYLSYEIIDPPNPIENQVPIGNPVTPTIQPLIQPASSDFPPQNVVDAQNEKPMIFIYNDSNQRYNSGSGSIYGAPPVAPPSIYTQQNIHGNVPLPPSYPSPQ